MDRFQGASASHPDLVRTTRVPRQVDASVPDAPASLVPTAVRWAAVGLLLAQLGLMLAFSEVEYRRFCLTKDFATYSQAWWAISHGHLDPTSTVLGLPFWRNNAELVLWPLSLLHLLDPHPLVLLWVQDLCVVATEAVALTWVSRVVERSRLGSLPATLLVGWSAGRRSRSPPTRGRGRRSRSTSTRIPWPPSSRRCSASTCGRGGDAAGSGCRSPWSAASPRRSTWSVPGPPASSGPGTGRGGGGVPASRRAVSPGC